MNLKKWNKREKKNDKKKWRWRNRAIFARIGEKCGPRQLSLAETRVKFSVVLKPWRGEWSEAQDEWKSRFRSLFQAVASRQNAPVDPVRANSSDVWQKKVKKKKRKKKEIRLFAKTEPDRRIVLFVCEIGDLFVQSLLSTLRFPFFLRALVISILISWYFSYGIRLTQSTLIQVKKDLVGGFVNAKNILRNISIFIANVSTRLVF